MSGGLTGWETMIGEDGEIYQAGIPSCPAEEHDDGLATFGWITRAVVMAVYFTDEDVRKDWTNDKQRAVLCDVRTIGRYSRLLFKVPVLQRTQGLWDEDLYIPRAAKLDINGGTFASGSAGVDGNAPTPAEQTDGDHVLVTFLDNDPRQPVILPFTLGHPNSNTIPKKADGRFRRIRHNGVVIEFDKDGNLTLDARKAAKPDLDRSGKEQSNSGTSGKIKIITKDGSDKESSVYLDEKGGIKLLDASGDFVELTRDLKQIELNAGTTIKETAGVKMELAAGAQLEATAPATKFTAAATFEVTSASVTLGAPAAVPLVMHTPWVQMWVDLLTEVTTQAQVYTGPPPPAVVSVGDYLNLLTKIKLLATAYPAVMCAIVKGI